MKMRKLFAGLAAAATLFGGLAFGATTANAADGGADISGNTIEVTTTDSQQFYKDINQTQLREFKYVKLASYELVANNKGVNLKGAVQQDASIGDNKTVADAFTTLGYDDAAKEKYADPWVWFGNTSHDATALKTFTQSLASLAETPIIPTPSTEKTTLTFKFDGTDAGAGLYLIVDQSGDLTVEDNTTHTLKWTGMAPILAGTAITGITVPGADGSVIQGVGDGRVELKSDRTDTPKSGVSWEKVAANGTTALKGAEFRVYEGSNLSDDVLKDANQALKFVATNTPGTYNLAGKEDRNTTVTLTNASNGSFVLQGLKISTTYTVVETKVPDGYAQYFAKFEVTTGANAQTVPTYTSKDIWGLAGDVSKDGHKVKNVQNITQLPKTGAAGIAMFGIAGLLLAAAAGTVFVKSRSTKRALRA
ncbi:SpaA isopeptide-forming pilin-related protein [Bifidobacterium platyrrhinorum]|uniref:LPXTG cell wall anchor domain-containing protein n=1 Tax=Bifidobacterium platyrrhinorum TaxID=2661628 RepID=A0A6L9SU59_9BIFI|nr:SpaA isopeptide-forming pilin-related protein [Bifidobacterium platyrrhinorum]NEG55343.1 LPXTG cell wall anchor domain-containing protein [Bifidobacterium platyrrhinorum]